jgi:hypothetical protein
VEKNRNGPHGDSFTVRADYATNFFTDGVVLVEDPVDFGD